MPNKTLVPDKLQAALLDCNTVIFGSRIHAGKVDGLKKTMGLFQKSNMKNTIVFATGGTPNAAEKEIDAVWKNSLSEDELKTIPIFICKPVTAMRKCRCLTVWL